MSEEITSESMMLDYFGVTKWRATEYNYSTGTRYPFTSSRLHKDGKQDEFDSVQEIIDELTYYDIRKDGDTYYLYNKRGDIIQYSITIESFKRI